MSHMAILSFYRTHVAILSHRWSLALLYPRRGCSVVCCFFQPFCHVAILCHHFTHNAILSHPCSHTAILSHHWILQLLCPRGFSTPGCSFQPLNPHGYSFPLSWARCYSLPLVYQHGYYFPLLCLAILSHHCAHMALLLHHCTHMVILAYRSGHVTWLFFSIINFFATSVVVKKVSVIPFPTLKI